MTKFSYNNTKNASINHIFFKFNRKYYFHISYKKIFKLCLKSKTIEESSFKLWNLIAITSKISIILKSFKNKLIIKVLNLKAIFNIIKFG